MCIGDNPVARMMPFLIAGIVFAILTSLIYVLPLFAKLGSKSVKILRIVFIVISVILLLLALFEYSIRLQCLS